MTHSDETARIEYVVGFAFDTDGRVALIRKNRPAWQAGRLNGIGGHIEPSDPSPWAAMCREWCEETGQPTPANWREFVVMDFPGARIHFFRALGLWPDWLDACRTTTDEEVCLVTVGDANQHLLIPNLTWLIPLARYTADEYEPIHVQASMAEVLLSPASAPGEGSAMSNEKALCPTCTETTLETHPWMPDVQRCTNCKEWLRVDGKPFSPASTREEGQR